MPDTDRPAALLLVVMGVSGSGKSTIAEAVAKRLGLPYVDGDDLHPQSNVDKMHAGHPLDDDDRRPWLDRVAAALRERAEGGAVLACSALKRAYRDRLRRGAGDRLRFAFLDVDFDAIARRLEKRAGHFMPRELLRSQFDTLERPAPDETDVATVAADGSVEEVAAAVAARFGG